MEDHDNTEVERKVVRELVSGVVSGAKLIELLHNINSVEIKLCSDAAKEFIKLLKGNNGGGLLHLYVKSSPKLLEILEAWKLREDKQGMSYILSLISTILSHPDGLYRPNDKERIAISRVLDKFARLLIEEKLKDVYKELNSKEGKRQNAVLMLLASIVRRGSSLASEVAKNFDFKLQSFSKLAECRKKHDLGKRKHLTRKSFVGFAMSFLEVGKPGLLRWILQQKEMYSGVLRGLGNDDDETVMYVLSTLQHRVLTEESLVPPGLRSVLFGSVTLEQLVRISARDDAGPASEMAHCVLVMVCTDPCNGLMPDLKRSPNTLRGNVKRLLALMQKLKATESAYHQDLLLAIVKGRPVFGSAYLDEFPYNLEDYASRNWFATISLAANLVSSVDAGLPFGFLESQSHDPPSFNSADVQSIMNCICPRPFTRSIINKGLLHSDFIVKHGMLRFLLQQLKLLDHFFRALDCNSCSGSQIVKKWVSLKQEIQNGVRTLLPDPQVLLTLLSSLSSQTLSHDSCLKRKADGESILGHNSKGIKKLKTDTAIDDTDIIVGGITSTLDISFLEDNERAVDTMITDRMDAEKDFLSIISEIWALDLCCGPVTSLKEAETYFYSRLLDALKIYLRTLPSVLEGSFDFFMNFLSNPLAVPTDLQCSLLALLIECTGWTSTSDIRIRTPPLMYKHLQPFINLLIFSPVKDIKDQAYNLARAAMLSTGAFDRNSHEIAAWFLFLPGYSRNKLPGQGCGVEMPQNLSQSVISFFCDAISTVGNNLFKYADIIQGYTFRLKDFKDVLPDFSPLIICVLQKCLRLLNAGSGTFSLPEKSMMLLYVCSTLKYILQTQVDAGLLSALIEAVLTEGLDGSISVSDGSGDFLSEWRPLRNLLLFSQSLSTQQACGSLLIDKIATSADDSFASALKEVLKLVRSGDVDEIAGVATAFSSAILCATPDGILKIFPTVIIISQSLFGIPIPLLWSIIFLEQRFLDDVSKLWPEMFFSGVKLSVSVEEKEDDGGGFDHALLAGEELCNMDFNATESAISAFSFFLMQAPFHLLFPAVISTGVPCYSEPSRVQELLLAKLSECPSDSLISSLRLVLFWFHQIQSFYRIKPMVKFIQLSEICLMLVKYIFTQLVFSKSKSECPASLGVSLLAHNIPVLTETIFSHPAVIVSLVSPLSCNEEVSKENLRGSFENFLSSSKERLHVMDRHVLSVLTTIVDFWLSVCNGQHFVLENCAIEPLLNAFNKLVHRLFLELRNKFELCIKNEDFAFLLPAFYALNALNQFVSPFELLELVHWMFSRVDIDELTVLISGQISYLSVAFSVAAGALDGLSNYLQQHVNGRLSYNFFWEMEKKDFDINLVERIYMEVCKFAASCKVDVADKCLLKVVHAVNRQKCMEYHSLHPLSLVLSRVVTSTPIEMISHLVYSTSMTKAKLLFLLTEMSPMHLSFFGHLLLGILDKDSHLTGKDMEETCACTLSDEQFMMLLPAALSYLNSCLVKFDKPYYKHFSVISSFYSRMILNGFRAWNSFVHKCIFWEEYGESLPSSLVEVLILVNGSLLGKAIQMLQLHFAFSGDSITMEKTLKLFNSILPPSHDQLLDYDVNEMDFSSVSQSLNLINQSIMKISFCRMLLFLDNGQSKCLAREADEETHRVSLQMQSTGGDTLRIRFVNILVGSWQWMVENFPCVSESSRKGKSRYCLSLYKFLEDYILRNIFELTEKMCGSLISSESFPILEQLMRASLHHRFEDLTTMKMLRSILTLLSEGNFSCGLCLQLLLEHPPLTHMIQCVPKPANSQTGVLFRPMSSILRSLVVPQFNPDVTDGKDDPQTTDLHRRQLEIVKIVRILLKFTPHQCGFDFRKNLAANLRKFHLLLLSSYGATLNEIDLEIYKLMQEIECVDKLNCETITEMDYLWGSAAALKIRKERAVEAGTMNSPADEAVDDRRRSLFRDILPVDPKICAATVLNFPYDTATGDETSSLNELSSNSIMDMLKRQCCDAKSIQRYDPVFILRFSVHSLTMGYIEPVEFAGLGLLAFAFVSMSSNDVSIRKLGYETLGRFKNALEKAQKRKDVTRLRLLLTYVQNGIEEPWQRIPSVISLFAAEASFLLLDPSHDHYTTLNKLLMRNSGLNIKHIPLFRNFFWSTSVNYRAERLWILRLAYAGLNSDDDAQIYIRNSIIEIFLSYYASPLSDNESKEIILQIVKKSVKLHKMTRHLVEYCGLLPWLSSMLSVYRGMLLEEHKRFCLTQLAVVIEVVNDITASRSIMEWLQNYSLEQLMELSCHLYKLLVGGMKLIEENATLVNSVLRIMIATMKMSQKRKLYQPHFTLSLEGLFHVSDAVSTSKPTENAELALIVILMSTPPIGILDTDQEKLSRFVIWAVSTALRSNSRKMCLAGDFNPMTSGEKFSDECLISKLLRWLTASVIRGRLSQALGNLGSKYSEKTNAKTLQCLMQFGEKERGEGIKGRQGCEEMLGGTIFFLQQLLEIRCKVPTSVVSSLCLLLLCGASVDKDFTDGERIFMASLCSRIHCPAEANPAWRWSFYQPWKDLSSEPTNLEKIDELHACQTLLVLISNVLAKKSLDSRALSIQGVENSGVFKWERSLLESE